MYNQIAGEESSCQYEDNSEVDLKHGKHEKDWTNQHVITVVVSVAAYSRLKREVTGCLLLMVFVYKNEQVHIQ